MYYKPTDSIQVSFSKCFARGPKGSRLTHVRARNTYRRFEEFCKENQLGIIRPDTITGKLLRLYLESREAEGIAGLTLQNEIAHIRRAARYAGRELGDIRKADNPFSNKRCGLLPQSRKSNKKPCSLEMFNCAMTNASPGLRLALLLMKVIGLRGQEAVMAGNIQEWKLKLQNHNPDRALFLLITVGTKGGRPRDIFIHPLHIEEVKNVIERVCEYLQAHKHLIEADGLQKAMSNYHNEMTKLEMVSDDSGHGLRRLFAWNQYQDYLVSGLSEEASLSRLAQDLGHGEGRGRWVKNSYLGGVL